MHATARQCTQQVLPIHLAVTDAHTHSLSCKSDHSPPPPNHQTKIHSNTSQGLRHGLTVPYFTCMPHITSLVCILCTIPGLHGSQNVQRPAPHLPACHKTVMHVISYTCTAAFTTSSQLAPAATSSSLEAACCSCSALHCTGPLVALAKTDHSLLVALPNLHAA